MSTFQTESWKSWETDFLKSRFMKSRGARYHPRWYVMLLQVSKHVLVYYLLRTLTSYDSGRWSLGSHHGMLCENRYGLSGWPIVPVSIKTNLKLLSKHERQRFNQNLERLQSKHEKASIRTRKLQSKPEKALLRTENFNQNLRNLQSKPEKLQSKPENLQSKPRTGTRSQSTTHSS